MTPVFAGHAVNALTADPRNRGAELVRALSPDGRDRLRKIIGESEITAKNLAGLNPSSAGVLGLGAFGVQHMRNKAAAAALAKLRGDVAHIMLLKPATTPPE